MIREHVGTIDPLDFRHERKAAGGQDHCVRLFFLKGLDIHLAIEHNFQVGQLLEGIRVVTNDVLDGFISPEKAKRVYGFRESPRYSVREEVTSKKKI
jgi:hypothetical protein